MAFDPDAYLAEKPAGGFDPDAYLREGPAPMRPPASGSEWSQKAGEGSMPGFNRTAAALGAAVYPALEKLSGRYAGWGNTYGERYQNLLRANQGQSAQTQREHPYASPVLQAGGALLSAPAMPGAAKIAEEAPLLTRVATMAKPGAAIGAAYGAGDAPADADLSTLAAHTVGGAAGGSLLGAGAGALMPSHQVPSLAPSLLPRESPLAESAAVRSTNADRTAYRRAFGRPADREAVSDTGRFLLDSGVPLRSPAKMQEGLEKIIASEGPSIGQLPKAAGKSGATFDLEGAALKALDSPQIAKLGADTEGRPTYNRIAEFLSDKVKALGGATTPEQGHKLRMRLDELAKWDKTRPDDVNVAWRAARDAVSEELGATMDRAGMGDAWQAANSRFAQAKTAKDLADVGAERRSGNKLLQLGEWGAGLAGGAAAALHRPEALLGAGAVIGANRYGMPAAARTLDAISRVRAPQLLSAASPAPRAAATLAALRRPGVPELLPAWANPDRSSTEGR